MALGMDDGSVSLQDLVALRLEQPTWRLFLPGSYHRTVLAAGWLGRVLGRGADRRARWGILSPYVEIHRRVTVAHLTAQETGASGTPFPQSPARLTQFLRWGVGGPARAFRDAARDASQAPDVSRGWRDEHLRREVLKALSTASQAPGVSVPEALAWRRLPGGSPWRPHARAEVVAAMEVLCPGPEMEATPLAAEEIAVLTHLLYDTELHAEDLAALAPALTSLAERVVFTLNAWDADPYAPLQPGEVVLGRGNLVVIPERQAVMAALATLAAQLQEYGPAAVMPEVWGPVAEAMAASEILARYFAPEHAGGLEFIAMGGYVRMVFDLAGQVPQAWPRASAHAVTRHLCVKAHGQVPTLWSEDALQNLANIHATRWAAVSFADASGEESQAAWEGSYAVALVIQGWLTQVLEPVGQELATPGLRRPGLLHALRRAAADNARTLRRLDARRPDGVDGTTPAPLGSDVTPLQGRIASELAPHLDRSGT